MRAPQHWNLELSQRYGDRLLTFQRNAACDGYIRRIYTRLRGEWVGIGYVCDACYETHYDALDDLDAELHLELSAEDF